MFSSKRNSERLLSGTRGSKQVVFAVRELMLPHNSWMCSTSSCSCHSSSLLLQACLVVAFVCSLHDAFPPGPAVTFDDFFVFSSCSEYSFIEIIICALNIELYTNYYLKLFPASWLEKFWHFKKQVWYFQHFFHLLTSIVENILIYSYSFDRNYYSGCNLLMFPFSFASLCELATCLLKALQNTYLS